MPKKRTPDAIYRHARALLELRDAGVGLNTATDVTNFLVSYAEEHNDSLASLLAVQLICAYDLAIEARDPNEDAAHEALMNQRTSGVQH